jgi:hypothetical protein
MKNEKTTAQNANVNKSNATSKANELLLSDMLLKVNKGLLISNKGQSKESIYKANLFAEMTDKEKKTYRRKIRNLIDNFCDSFLKYNEQNKKQEIEKLVIEFDSIYKNIFVKNDYSFDSVSSENSKDTRKKDIIKMFDIIKANKK